MQRGHVSAWAAPQSGQKRAPGGTGLAQRAHAPGAGPAGPTRVAGAAGPPGAGGRRAAGGLAHRLPHGLAHGDARAEAGAGARHAALVGRRHRDGLRGLELRVAAHVADHAHADALVQPLLQLVGQRDVLDLEALQRQAEVGEHRPQLVGDRRPQLDLVGRHVEEGDVALGEVVGQHRHHRVAQLALEVADARRCRGVPETFW